LGNLESLIELVALLSEKVANILYFGMAKEILNLTS